MYLRRSSRIHVLLSPEAGILRCAFLPSIASAFSIWGCILPPWILTPFGAAVVSFFTLWALPRLRSSDGSRRSVGAGDFAVLCLSLFLFIDLLIFCVFILYHYCPYFIFNFLRKYTTIFSLVYIINLDVWVKEKFVVFVFFVILLKI